MSYYEYNFISAEPLFAKIEEEMRSYFSTGMIDALLFPIYTKYCLDRLGKASLPINEILLVVENNEARLPPDFHSVREARMCTQSGGFNYTLPTSFYKATTYKLDTAGERIDSCAPCDPCDLCEKTISVVYKTDQQIVTPTFNVYHLLKPGNISCLNKCASDCRNINVSSMDTFDIHSNKFVTNFNSGNVYLVYYGNKYDDEGTDMIPDNVKIIDYIEHYIKFKLYEQLWNQVTDETYNQIERKYQVYKQEMAEKFVTAETETKKETTQKQKDAIQHSYRRNSRYNIR